MTYINGNSVEFYNKFEKIVLDCNTTGFVQIAKKYGQEFLKRVEEFENQEWVTTVKCQQELMLEKVIGWVEYPKCDEIFNWGVASLYECIISTAEGGNAALETLSDKDIKLIREIG